MLGRGCGVEMRVAGGCGGIGEYVLSDKIEGSCQGRDVGL